jgi:gas vesicle protein
MWGNLWRASDLYKRKYIVGFAIGATAGAALAVLVVPPESSLARIIPKSA